MTHDHVPGGSLGGLPMEPILETRMINAENPTGAKGGACLAVPDPSDPDLFYSKHSVRLGKGWKVRPFIRLPAGETVTLADIEGPATIRQFWITSDAPQYRSLVLRIWWDGEEAPSVETPLGDFFAMGHDASPHEVYSAPITVAPRRGLNSYWSMPFRRSARVTLSNEAERDVEVVAWKLLYHLGEVPEGARYLHAQWRRSLTRREHPEHVILDGVRGGGHYVGTYLAWTALSRGWWGEGEVKFFLDGDGEHPTIADNGTEDYFGGAWCFDGNADVGRPERPYNSPYLGMPLVCVDDVGGPRRFSLYRWHVLDAIGFREDLRVTVQALGWWPDRTYEPLTDDIASLAVWYQAEPHAPFPALPPIQQRWGR